MKATMIRVPGSMPLQSHGGAGRCEPLGHGMFTPGVDRLILDGTFMHSLYDPYSIYFRMVVSSTKAQLAVSNFAELLCTCLDSSFSF